VKESDGQIYEGYSGSAQRFEQDNENDISTDIIKKTTSINPSSVNTSRDVLKHVNLQVNGSISTNLSNPNSPLHAGGKRRILIPQGQNTAI